MNVRKCSTCPYVYKGSRGREKLETRQVIDQLTVNDLENWSTNSQDVDRNQVFIHEQHLPDYTTWKHSQ